MLVEGEKEAARRMASVGEGLGQWEGAIAASKKLR